MMNGYSVLSVNDKDNDRLQLDYISIDTMAAVLFMGLANENGFQIWLFLEPQSYLTL